MPDHASLHVVFIFKGDSRRKGKGNRKKDARLVIDVRLSHREFKLFVLLSFVWNTLRICATMFRLFSRNI